MVCVESLERGGESGVTVGRGPEEAVVGGGLLGGLPDTLDGIELRRVRREAEELDAVTAPCEPLLAGGVEVVAGPVVDDEEDLAATAGDEMLEKLEEGR